MIDASSSVLRLNRLRISVRLGWTQHERSEPQLVEVDLALRFADRPGACRTDDITGTVNYAQLADQVRATGTSGEFRLIERLTAVLHEDLSALVPEGCRLAVRVSKDPRLDGVTGGASFAIGWEERPTHGD